MKSNDICNAHEWDEREEVHLGRISWHVNKVGVIILEIRNFVTVTFFLAFLRVCTEIDPKLAH